MTEEDIQNDPDDKFNQGHHSYIEIWFQQIIIDIITIKAASLSYSSIYQNLHFKLV